jgi:hypothetical protein
MLKYLLAILIIIAPVGANAETRTYIFNGLFGGLPSIGYGMRNLAGKISGSILKPHRSDVTKKIIADYRSRSITGVNLIGHSLGAIRANRIATELKKHRIPVRYLALIDSPRNLTAPRGVRCNVFRQWKKGTVKNCREIVTDARSHLQIGDDIKVHRTILNAIR